MKVELKSISDKYEYIGEVPCFFVIPITYDNASSQLKESRGFMGPKSIVSKGVLHLDGLSNPFMKKTGQNR